MLTVERPLPTATSFGALLKQLRKRAGMTQSDLAAATGYSVSLIGQLEQNQRLPNLRAITETFVPALGLQDDDALAACLITQAAVARGERPPALVTHRRVSHPPDNDRHDPRPFLRHPPTQLIGRHAEISQISNRLQGHQGRLLTLIGPPGVGKTSLALAVAHRLQSDYADGVIFVALAAVSDAALMADSILAACAGEDFSAKPPKTRLIEWLRRRALLLVLDNLEQIAGAAPIIADLIAACPQLHILATSRERLHLRAEQRHKVLPLDLAAAIELFLQRAQAVEANVTLAEHNQSTIAMICQCLDRLPLAIELCAAQSDLLSLDQILRELQTHPLSLLVDGSQDLPPHQRTLYATIQRSYHLLDAAERTLFRCIGVFAGGFDLSAIAQVSDWQESLHQRSLIAVLRALLGKSMMHSETLATGEQRYYLLETVRQFALEQLVAVGEIAPMRLRHAEYFLNLTMTAEQQTAGKEKMVWLNRLQCNYDNLRTALDWLLVTDTQAAQRMTSLLHPFWLAHGLFREGHYWLSKVLAVSTLSMPSRAWTLQAMADLAQRQGDYVSAQQLASESLTFFQKLENQVGCVAALRVLGWTLADMQMLPQALIQFEQSLSLARQTEQQQLVANALTNIAEILIRQGVTGETVQHHLQESALIYQKHGELEGLAHVCHVKAIAQMLNDDYTHAQMLWQEALTIRQQLGNKWEVAWILYYLGKASWLVGDRLLAADYWKEVHTYFHNISSPLGLMYVFYEFGQIERCWYKNFEQAAKHYQKSVELAKEMKYSLLLGRCLVGLGGVALACGQPNRAVYLLGKAQGIADSLTGSLFMLSDNREEYATMVDEACMQLGQIAFTAAWSKGQAMTLDEAVAYALTVEYHGNLEKTSC